MARADSKNKSSKILGCVDCRTMIVLDVDRQPSFGVVDAKGWHCQQTKVDESFVKGLLAPSSRG